jgi:hypothetical protein
MCSDNRLPNPPTPFASLIEPALADLRDLARVLGVPVESLIEPALADLAAHFDGREANHVGE